jgi:hypothetical protein
MLARRRLPVTIKSYLPLDALVSAKRHIEADEAAEVIDQILQRPAVLIAAGPKALLDVITDLSDLRDVLLQKDSEPLPGRVLAGRIIKVADQCEDVSKVEVHAAAL